MHESASANLVTTHFGGGSPVSWIVDRTLRSTVKPVISLWSKAPDLPWPYAVVDYLGRPLTRVRGTTVQPVRLRNCRAEIVTPPGDAPVRTMLYLHGGAFLVGGRHLHRQLISKIADHTRSTVLAVDYRQMPKHAVSTSVEDCVDAYRHLLSEGNVPEDILIAGDSAGGYLTFMTAIVAMEEGLPAPAALVALSPLTDLEMANKLGSPSSVTCSIFPRHTAPALYEMYEAIEARSGSRRRTGSASPVDCELHGLPPTLIQASTSEMLYPDAVLMAQRLAESGVPVELQTWDGQAHVFQAGAGIMREAAHAVSNIGEFIERVMPVGAAADLRAIG